jgi:hypothetical protein
MRLSVATHSAFLLLLAAGPPQAALGQESARAFGSIALTLSAGADVNSSAFHDRWDPGLGVEAGIELPFYLGMVEAGAQQFSNRSRVPGVPGFRSRLYYVGWGLDVPAASRLRWYNGFRLGVYDMAFHDGTVPPDEESELSIGLHSRASLRLTRRWEAGVGGRYTVTLTSERIRQLVLAAGVSYRFDTPGWLKDFFE